MSSEIERISPTAGHESVWDYPRPPKLERVTDRLRVVYAGLTIADTISGFRLLETSHPPVYYIPPVDIAMTSLLQEAGQTICEFKGVASYWSLDLGGRFSRNAAWSYPEPAPAYRPIRDHMAFYASRVDACFVGEERVAAQKGDFYGGWITSRIVGPFKGPPGTRFW